MKTAEIIPAILVHNRNALIHHLRKAEKSAKRAQIDIIDGKFAKNTTIHPRDFAKLHTKLHLEFHLMVKHPESFIHEVAEIPAAKTIIIHIESLHSHEYAVALLEHIKFHKLKVGLALNPETPAHYVKPFLPMLDLVLVMTVHPGFMGHGFINMGRKIRQIREWDKKIDIEVDGGIHLGTARLCRAAGANLFVVGSALYQVKDFAKAYALLKKDAA
jgi:ribulose-phosphate 3-epimerase